MKSEEVKRKFFKSKFFNLPKKRALLLKMNLILFCQFLLVLLSHSAWGFTSYREVKAQGRLTFCELLGRVLPPLSQRFIQRQDGDRSPRKDHESSLLNNKGKSFLRSLIIS